MFRLCYSNAMSKRNQHPSPFFAATLTNIAREFRREPTSAEKALWRLIRKKQLAGWKFRRQHLIGRYIADFCCPKAHLIIEVDGDIHRQQVETDQEREQALVQQGYRILRFTNRQVFETPDEVVQKIQQAL